MVDIVKATSEAQQTIARVKTLTKSVELIGDVLLLATVIWLQKWNLVAPTFKELRADSKAGGRCGRAPRRADNRLGEERNSERRAGR